MNNPTPRTARQQRRTLSKGVPSGNPKKTRPYREPTFMRDTDGVAIVLVPLPKGGSAKALATCYQAHRAKAFSGQWLLGSNGRTHSYVRMALTGASGNLISVGRLLLNAPKGTHVKYRDGNRLNLRLDNLYTSGGYSKGRERDANDAREGSVF